MSSFLFVADFDFEDILKEYPDLFGNMENESKDWRPMTISLTWSVTNTNTTKQSSNNP
jgi:hypothetical protein